jgi:hemoglobin
MLMMIQQKRSNALLAIFGAVVLGCWAGCGTTEKSDVVSGSPAADERASQIVSDKGKSKKNDGKGGTNQMTLYERLGSEPGIQRIVDNFVDRALQDPRVNWSRKGVEKGGLLRRDKSVEWQATEENVATLKKHFAQFISVASGGPAEYAGKPIEPAHADMKITEPEFEATIGDLKATLDHLKIPADVQKDLIAIFESTRMLITVKRR